MVTSVVLTCSGSARHSLTSRFKSATETGITSERSSATGANFGPVAFGLRARVVPMSLRGNVFEQSSSEHCTGLENRRRLAAFGGSNPPLSAFAGVIGDSLSLSKPCNCRAFCFPAPNHLEHRRAGYTARGVTQIASRASALPNRPCHSQVAAYGMIGWSPLLGDSNATTATSLHWREPQSLDGQKQI